MMHLAFRVSDSGFGFRGAIRVGVLLIYYSVALYSHGH